MSENISACYRITLVRADPNYGQRFHKGCAAAHFLKAYLRRYARSKDQLDIDIAELNSCWPNAADLNAQWILSRAPDLIGFSCYCWNIEIVTSLARLIKDLSPEVLIVGGGPEISFCAEEFLSSNDAFDFVVRGEGEATFCELVDRLMSQEADLSQVAGLTYRHAGKIVSNLNRPLISNLDTIPSPFLEGTLDLWQTDGEVMIETVRGCPYRCTYCLHTKGTVGVRSFSWERIEAEVTFLCQHPAINVIWFADPTFDADEQRALRILDLVLRVNPEQGVAFELRAEMLAERIIQHLSRLNVVDVGIGLQSTNPHTLRLLRRPANLSRFRENVLKLKEAFRYRPTRVDIDVIYGLPGDAFEDYMRTVDFALSLGGHVYYQPLRVFQGAAIATQAASLGLGYIRQAPHNVFCSNTFSREDIVRAYQMNAGLDLYQSGEPALRKSLNAISQAAGMTTAQTCAWVGSQLWKAELRRCFRVSNASPDDIPALWRVEDLLKVLDSEGIETVVPSPTRMRLKEALEEARRSLAGESTQSGYYHAAI